MNQNNKAIQYAKDFPKEVKLAIKALDDETRLSILVLLMENMKMTFTELKKSLDLNSSSLSNHLSIMQDGGLVDNFLKWNKDSYSYYAITTMAKDLLKSIFDTIVKPPTTDRINLWNADAITTKATNVTGKIEINPISESNTEELNRSIFTINNLLLNKISRGNKSNPLYASDNPIIWK